MAQESSTHTEPQANPGQKAVIEIRPEGQLARGNYAFPAWGIVSLGVVTVLLGLAFLVWRVRSAK